ncbi:hypothetical protein FNAPI_11899 [Fusarium napiforme]|uniref:Uncharacterized protein n=1 Tax=Fusarium napiforme TaxID=42672 RepID=A0A8H5IFT2_9HYPO|nr:hypothetical protein FNAPI_11899 [Fusarium napiforme]
MNIGAQPENESFEMANRPVSPLSLVAEEDDPESVDTGALGTPKPEDTQHGTQSDHDGLLAPSREDKITEDLTSVHTDCPLNRHVLYSLITIAFIGSASLISSCWLIAYIQVKTDRSYIAAVIVGGKLSSTEAKLIDAAFSILVAPAVVAVANWHMFKLARLSAVNEHSGRNSAVSMKVLVEVASTDWGSFSPLKFWTFVRSRRLRVICLGMIAVLSALSFSLLGNAVAYQQAGVDTSSSPSHLRDVSMMLPDKRNQHLRFVLEETASVFGSESITYEASLGTDQIDISDIVLNGKRDTYPLIAFNETALWIGVMNSGYDDAPVVTTERWGSLIPFAKGLPGTEHRQTNHSLAYSGLTCRLNRSTGWADVKVNGSDWSMIENTVVDEKPDTGHDIPVLSLTPRTDTFDDRRDGRPSGLGGHLLRAALGAVTEGSRQIWDLETLADAFLWYEIEARQVLLDNDQTVRAERYQVQSNIDEYAITFVPWILMFGLGTLGAACTLTIGLTLDSWRVYSLRTGRMLDSIRLTADVGVALDKQVFEECSTWHATRLNKCADEARFQYEPEARLDSATGIYTLGIRLRQISRPHD